MYRWIVIMTKIVQVFRYDRLKQATIRTLGFDLKDRQLNSVQGKRTFLTIFQYIKTMPEKTREEVIEYTRVLGNELVGKFLGVSDHSKKMPTEDPSTCTHPDQAMRRRANALTSTRMDGTHRQWWTCLHCHSRWERLPMPDRANPVDDSDLMVYGKHIGRTYATVYQSFPQYAHWTMNTAEDGEPSHPDLLRFAQYCSQRRKKEYQDLLDAHEAPFPDEDGEDWEMNITEAERASMDAAELEHRRAAQHELSDCSDL